MISEMICIYVRCEYAQGIKRSSSICSTLQGDGFWHGLYYIKKIYIYGNTKNELNFQWRHAFFHFLIVSIDCLSLINEEWARNLERAAFGQA